MTRLCVVGALLLLAACRVPGNTNDTTSLVRGGSGSARMTYQPNAHVVERKDALASLAGVSTDGATLLFDPAIPAVRSLHAGDVLVVKGLFARKVLAVETDGSLVALLTAATSFGEVIRDGRIHLDAPFRFSPSVAIAAPRSPFDVALDFLVPRAHAQDLSQDLSKDAADAYTAEKYGGKAVKVVKDGWDTKFSATPGAGRVDMSLVLARDVGGFKGLITAKGYVADFDLSSDIEVEQGILERLSVTYKRVNGLMNVNWEVGKESPGGFSQASHIKLPGALTIPLYQLLEGFPLFLEVSAAVIVQPVITGGMQFSHGNFRVTWDGAQHFSAKAGNIDPDGKVTGDIKLLEDRHISAVAPVGMVVSMAAPRIELTMNPLKMLSEIQGEGSLQNMMKKAAEQADAWGARLAKMLERTSLATAVQGLPPLSATTVVNAMKSDAAALIQFVSMSATTNSGLSVIAPCTHTDLMVQVTVGASAQAFGQKVKGVSKVIFEKKIKQVDPPKSPLCQY